MIPMARISASSQGRKRALLGLNMNVRVFDESIPLDNAKDIAGDCLRIPGGQTTNYIDMRTGAFDRGDVQDTGLNYEQVAGIMTELGIDKWVVGVPMHKWDRGVTDNWIEMPNSEIIAMLDAAAAYFPVTHVELGNETFASSNPYAQLNPDPSDSANANYEVTEYVAKCQSVMAAVRALPRFDNTKFGAVAIGKRADSRILRGWNSIVSQLAGGVNPVDAFIYHVYIQDVGALQQTPEQRISLLNSEIIRTSPQVETWITEYGSKRGTTEEISEAYNKFTNYFVKNFDVANPYAITNFNNDLFAMIKQEDGELTQIGQDYKDRLQKS